MANAFRGKNSAPAKAQDFLPPQYKEPFGGSKKKQGKAAMKDILSSVFGKPHSKLRDGPSPKRKKHRKKKREK